MPYKKSNKQIQDSAFTLRSGNKSPLEFKAMGSSPAKWDPLAWLRKKKKVPESYGQEGIDYKLSKDGIGTVLPTVTVSSDKVKKLGEGAHTKSKTSDSPDNPQGDIDRG